MQALTELSVADNQITHLPIDLSGLTSLQKLHIYGNQLQQLPLGDTGLPSLLTAGPPSSAAAVGNSSSSKRASGPSLRALWLEGNPLSPECVKELLRVTKGVSPERGLKVGFDQQQLAAVDAAEAGSNKAVRKGVVMVSRG